MKKLFILFLLPLFVGCEGLLPDDGNGSTNGDKSQTVSFTNGGINFTRVTDNQFDKDDQITVVSFENDSKKEQATYSFDGEKFTSTSAFELSDGMELAYLAIYPSTASLSGTFTTKVDQSTKADYEQSDLLAAAVATSSEATPQLTFNHTLSSIIFNVKVTENGVAKSGSSVKTTFNLKNQITVDVQNQSYEATGEVVEMTPYPNIGNGQSDAFNYSIIVAPQTVAANDVIATVVVDDNDIFYFTKTSDLTLQSSKQHTYTMTVDIITKKVTIEFGGSINNWGDANDDDTTTQNGWALADFSETNYPTDSDTWVITNATAETADFAGLQAAINALASSERKISLEFTNLGGFPDQALYADPNITSIQSIKADVATTIGVSSFSCCSSLATINLPAVDSISSSAFKNCSNLNSIDLPKVTFIGALAFNGCSSIDSIYLPQVTTIDMMAFMSCSNLSSINLPKVTKVWDCAFESCSSLNSIYLPMTTAVSPQAFGHCTSLTTVDMPVVDTIELWAFMGCTNLTTANLPLVTTIDDKVFSGCTNLITLSLATNSSTKLGSINTSAFGNSSIEANITLTVGAANSEYVNGNTLTVGDYSATFKEIILLTE